MISFPFPPTNRNAICFRAGHARTTLGRILPKFAHFRPRSSGRKNFPQKLVDQQTLCSPFSPLEWRLSRAGRVKGKVVVKREREREKKPNSEVGKSNLIYWENIDSVAELLHFNKFFVKKNSQHAGARASHQAREPDPIISVG